MKRVKSIAIPCILATAIYTLPVHPQRATDDIIAPARFDILRKAGPLQLWYIAAETKTGDARWQIPPGINTWNDWRRRAGHFGIHPWEGAGKFAPRNLKLSAATADSAQIGWIRHYASQLAPSWDEAYAMAVDGSGNVYVTGASTKLPYGLDGLTIKYNAAGSKIWEARYNNPSDGDDYALDVAVDAAGNVYVGGASTGAGTTWDYLVIKYNSAGVEQWVAHYDGAANSVDVAVAVAADKFGNVYVTGTSRNPATAQDIVTLKYRADDGKPLWIASHNGAENSSNRPAALAVDKSGNVYVAGSSFEAGKASSYLTIKYNPQGVEQWAARYSGNVNEFYEATGLGVDDLGNVFVTGYSYSPDYVQTTVKYSAAGVEQWVSKRHGVSASGVAFDFFGNPYVAGSTSGTYWSAYTVTKYIQSTQSLSLPDGYSLAQNYPNPFNYATSIRYALPASGRVTLKVFNLVGQEVTTVIDAERVAGIYEVDWGGEKLPSGVYVYRLQTNGFAQTKKFVLLK